MNIIINHSSMIPIYEQITAQIKASVMDGILKADDALCLQYVLCQGTQNQRADGEKKRTTAWKKRIRRHHPWKREFHRRRKSRTHAGRTPQRREADLETAIQKAASTVSPIRRSARCLN